MSVDEIGAFGRHDLFGLTGVALIVAAYAGLQLGRLEGAGLGYSLANLVGSGLILTSLLHTFNLASFVIEAFWIAISVVGLARWAWARRRG